MKKKYNINNTNGTNNVLFTISNGKLATQQQQQPGKQQKEADGEHSNEAADFETAISATGFGKYNLILFLVLIPSGFATMFDTTTMAFILPVAHCDLNLSLENKGMLNAVTYIGMISSGFFWGYLADTLGRKKLLICGYLLDGFFVLLCGISQQFTMLAIWKFMTGFIINGPFAALMSYINEFHSAKYRSFLPLANGVVHSIASIVLPLLGWLFLSKIMNISLFGGVIVLRSWNVFLLLCSLPSLIAGFAYTFLPESPKFLMTMGKNEQAYKIFQKVYACNTGKPPETYPIKSLLDETQLQKNSSGVHVHQVTVNRTKIQAIKEGWQQIIPLFHPPYLSKIVLVCSIQLSVVMGLNTLRLWLPQLFAAINDYKMFHQNEEDTDLCKMLEMVTPNKTAMTKDCFVNYDNDSVYTNNIIVAGVAMGGYLSAAALIRTVGKKMVLVGTTLTAGICGLCMYFVKTETVTVILSSIYNALTGISANVIISIVVDLFPTTLRTMTVALTMVCGRAGAMVGNLIFPYLLAAGCLPPFVMIGCLIIASSLLSVWLPKTDSKPLE